MSETKTYSGSCHCGKVRFEMTAEITRASVCNCSNLRCVEGLDVDALEVEKFDGRSYR